MIRSRRTCSHEEKPVALTDLALFKGAVTCTIQRWRAEHGATSATATWAEGSASREPATSATSNRDIHVVALNQIRPGLITKARLLLRSVEDMIPQASLAERIIAAARLIDRWETTPDRRFDRSQPAEAPPMPAPYLGEKSLPITLRLKMVVPLRHVVDSGLFAFAAALPLLPPPPPPPWFAAAEFPLIYRRLGSLFPCCRRRRISPHLPPHYCL